MSGEHDAQCEREYTESGYVFIDCLCHIRRAKAEAWDEGFDDGYDQRLFDDRGFPTDDDADTFPRTNPYRAAQVAPSRVPGGES